MTKKKLTERMAGLSDDARLHVDADGDLMATDGDADPSMVASSEELTEGEEDGLVEDDDDDEDEEGDEDEEEDED